MMTVANIASYCKPNQIDKSCLLFLILHNFLLTPAAKPCAVGPSPRSNLPSVNHELHTTKPFSNPTPSGCARPSRLQWDTKKSWLYLENLHLTSHVLNFELLFFSSAGNSRHDSSHVRPVWHPGTCDFRNGSHG